MESVNTPRAHLAGPPNPISFHLSTFFLSDRLAPVCFIAAIQCAERLGASGRSWRSLR